MTSYSWLAENGELGDKLRYRTWKDGMPAWTANPYEATWHCRKVDAEKANEGDSKVKAIAKHAFADDPLDVRFDSDAGDDLTVREYLKKLLMELWKEGESFNAKRPFGNSAWQYDLYKALIKGGFIDGALDKDGDIYRLDSYKADKYICALIEEGF